MRGFACGTTRDSIGSPCAGARKSMGNVSCFASCTTSKCWLIPGMRRSKTPECRTSPRHLRTLRVLKTGLRYLSRCMRMHCEVAHPCAPRKADSSTSSTPASAASRPTEPARCADDGSARQQQASFGRRQGTSRRNCLSRDAMVKVCSLVGHILGAPRSRSLLGRRGASTTSIVARAACRAPHRGVYFTTW